MTDSTTIQRALEFSQCGHLVISEGTVRAFDLYHALKDAIKLYNQDKVYLSKHHLLCFDVPHKARKDDQHRFWDTDEADELIGNLCGVLDGMSPKGYGFGTRPDNNSCFGWWPAVETIK